MCGKFFSQHSGLTVDQRGVHNVAGASACNNCEECFSQSSDLAIHCTVHITPPPPQASECGRAFNYQHELHHQHL